MSATAVPTTITQPALTSSVHPCLRCGACCASFRVAFYWAEAAPHTPDGIPEHLTRKLDPLRVAMDGTDQPQPRCVALRGSIGVDAHCGEYARRPSPCRALKPAWEDGQPSPQCDRARSRHGLVPLHEHDWTAWRKASSGVAAREASEFGPREPSPRGSILMPGTDRTGQSDGVMRLDGDALCASATNREDLITAPESPMPRAHRPAPAEGSFGGAVESGRRVHGVMAEDWSTAWN